MGTSGAKNGLLIAAPASGSGKTVITLALLRALGNAGMDICGAKAGPDYIDPRFHEVASKSPSVNLDPWAMDRNRLRSLINRQPAQNILVEGMMGLFDGAADGTASAAELASTLGIGVVLVVDCAKQSHSIAALVRGFIAHDERISITSVILNRVGSARHEKLLRDALLPLDVPILGAIMRDERLQLPERHLGLVQAQEHGGLDDFIEQAANIVMQNIDLDALKVAFQPVTDPDHPVLVAKAPAKHIAIARDEAFSFIYPHVLGDWQDEASGNGDVTLSWFSPLANEAPNEQAEFIYLPGGYPELHLETLAKAENFHSQLQKAAKRGVPITGECGGYMVLGRQIIDQQGSAHKMAGLLDLVTSFEKRKLHLGYRSLSHVETGEFVGKAHEFHYTSALEEEGEALYTSADALGEPLGKCGLKSGNVCGSYMHCIEVAANIEGRG